MTVAFGSVYGGLGATHASMSVFPTQRYKMGHKHDAGAVIVIPRGEGYSVLWKPDTNERLVCEWKEGSLLVPPHMWYHQHFNLGQEPARYLKLNGHIPAFRESHQIDYSQEDPWVRRRFEGELAKRGMVSAMPEECYTTPNYQWPYGEDMDGD
jgi:gentisate 1,2-dioxygenase